MNFANVLKNIPIGFYVMFGLFVVASILELFFAYNEKEKQRCVVKPFLLLFLAIGCWMVMPSLTFLVASLFCAMIGDIFVIIPNKKCFPIGVLFFFFAHILLMLEVIINCLNYHMSISQLIVVIAVFVVIFIASFFLVFKKIAGSVHMGLGMSLYYSTLITVLPFMCIATANFGYFMFLGIIGSVLFIVSDTILMYCKYGTKVKRHHFYIMLTYLLAEGLIITSFVLSYTAAYL